MRRIIVSVLGVILCASSFANRIAHWRFMDDIQVRRAKPIDIFISIPLGLIWDWTPELISIPDYNPDRYAHSWDNHGATF